MTPYLKDNLGRLTVFAFSTLKIWFHGRLAATVSGGSWPSHVLLSPVHHVSVNLWLLSRFFSLALVFSSLTMIYLDVVFFVRTDLLNFLDLWVALFHQIWDIFSHYFSKCLFFFPVPLTPFHAWVSSYTNDVWICSYGIKNMFIVFPLFLCFSDWLIFVTHPVDFSL